MPGTLELKMPNRLDALATTVDALLAWLEEANVPTRAVFAANLALEELVTNIIKYGYDDDKEHVITIRLTIEGGALSITVIDDGHEFNPFQQAAPDTSASMEDRAIGGLGIHFIRNLLDTCHYERRGGENHVTVTKRLNANSPA